MARGSYFKQSYVEYKFPTKKLGLVGGTIVMNGKERLPLPKTKNAV